MIGVQIFSTVLTNPDRYWHKTAKNGLEKGYVGSRYLTKFNSNSKRSQVALSGSLSNVSSVEISVWIHKTML